ncbi:hypothetical protein QZH41_014964, partial [Actinostola sp. cb2023]
QGGNDDPEITTVQSRVHASIGQPNVTLSCSGERVRKLDADTLWFYNGKELVQDDVNNTRFTFTTHYYDQRTLGVPRKVRMLLTINNVTHADRGNYTCGIFVNDKVANATIVLTVGTSASIKPKPRIPNALQIPEIVALAIATVFVVGVVVVAVAIFYRKMKKKIEPPNVPKGPFRYGAFITYSSYDYGWVEANLLPLLKQNDIEVCIHFRNFDIGMLLEENMVNSVYSSRVVIVVMSRSYMKSKYCRSELDYAIHRTVEEPDANPLITLRIDKQLKDSQLPRAIRNKTFLDVTSDVEKDIWRERLLMHVKGKADQNRNVLENEEHSLNSEVDAEQSALLDPGQDSNVTRVV